jgi:hypothetical protein
MSGTMFLPGILFNYFFVEFFLLSSYSEFSREFATKLNYENTKVSC